MTTAVPAPVPVTTPVELPTVPAPEQLQVPAPPSVSVILLPMHTAPAPDILPAVVLTVTVFVM